MTLTAGQKDWIEVEYSCETATRVELLLNDNSEQMSVMDAISKAEAELAGFFSGAKTCVNSQIIEVEES